MLEQRGTVRGVLGGGYMESNLHTISAGLPPANGAILARFPGHGFAVGAVEALAVVPCGIESCGAVFASFLDDYLFRIIFEGFAVVTGFVGAGGAVIADAGDGVLGEGGDGSNEKGDAKQYSGHDSFSIAIVADGI